APPNTSAFIGAPSHPSVTAPLQGVSFSSVLTGSHRRTPPRQRANSTARSHTEGQHQPGVRLSVARNSTSGGEADATPTIRVRPPHGSRRIPRVVGGDGAHPALRGAGG